ncbi:MAG: molybdenum cofactor biosynthesis protein MoaE [Candidatus Methanomethylicia archaeon]
MCSIFLGDIRSLNFNDLINRLKSTSPNVGCVLLFIGFVRSEGVDGGNVRNLVYEAYKDLAERELKSIVDDSMKVDGVYSIEIMHMIGSAVPGEHTFIVGVASKHRNEGFRVLRDVVERVKREVHIWKKEITDRGENWIIGGDS